MENPILNENKNISTRDNNTPCGSPAASTAASAPASTPASANYKVYPKPTFLKLLHSAGAKGKAFQESEIINYLKNYISSKKLFDQHKPWVVHCENDYLGAVFHCKQFTTTDVRGLLNQNVTMCNSDSIHGNEDDSFDSDATEIVSSNSDSDHEPPKKTTPLDDIISSSTSESPKPPISSCSTEDPLLRVNSSLLEILQDAGAKEEVFRQKEIFQHLKNYVRSRRLFDPLHPWICLCQNDKLANVFKCDRFLVRDVPHLVAKFGVEHPEYHRPKVMRSNTEPTPSKIAGAAVTLPLRSYVSSPGGRALSTPSDITSSTTDVMAPTSIIDHIDEQTPGRFEDSWRPAAAHRRSQETGHAAAPSRSAGEGRRVPSTLSSSLQEGGSSVPPGLSSERGSSVPPGLSFQREPPPAPSSSRAATSFTLTLEMQDDNEVLSFQSEEPVEDVYVEYEVMSNSDSFHMSDSEVEHHKVSMDMLVICPDSDFECYADYSDTGSDTDVELSEADKWCCSNCHLYNSPIHRLCDRCWALRPDWLPDGGLPDRDKPTPSSPKPEGDGSIVEHKHKPGSKPFQNPLTLKSSLGGQGAQRSKGNGANSSGEVSSSSEEDEDESFHSEKPTGGRSSRPPAIPSAEDYDTCLVNSQDLEKTVDISCNDNTLDSRTTLSNICHFTESESPARRTRNQTRNLKRDLISESDDSDYCPKLPKISSSSSSSPAKSLVAPGLCIICLHNPRDASLIHGASGHQICCLTCAKKLKQRGSKCPVCRRTIQKVVRNYLT